LLTLVIVLSISPTTTTNTYSTVLSIRSVGLDFGFGGNFPVESFRSPIMSRTFLSPVTKMLMLAALTMFVGVASSCDTSGTVVSCLGTHPGGFGNGWPSFVGATAGMTEVPTFTNVAVTAV
jgi:hypothetical protein